MLKEINEDQGMVPCFYGIRSWISFHPLKTRLSARFLCWYAPFMAFALSPPLQKSESLTEDSSPSFSRPKMASHFPSFEVLLWWFDGSLCPFKLFLSVFAIVLLSINLLHFFKLVSYRSEPRTTSSWKLNQFTLKDDISIVELFS